MDALPLRFRVTRLRHGDLPQIAAHFAALSERDLWLRFSVAPSEAAIDRYLQHLDFERDAFFGTFFGDRLAGFCHLGLGSTYAEFGISVHPDLRRRRLAQTMLGECMHFSRSRGCAEFFAQVLVENIPMRSLGAKMGLVARRIDSGEVHLALDLNAPAAPWDGLADGDATVAASG